MKVELDKEVDAAYISLQADASPEKFGFTYPCEPIETKAEINLDFDKNGMLIGIEVMDASKKLPLDVLKNAEIIDKNKNGTKD